MNRNGILIHNKTPRKARSSESLLNFNRELIFTVFQKCQSSKNLAQWCPFQRQPQWGEKNEPLKVISARMGILN